MQNALSVINKSIPVPGALFSDNQTEQCANKIMTSQMNGDSMQPTIQPGELIAFVDCGGQITSPGIYVFTRDVFGHRCLFIKRVEPMTGGALKIISDNRHYQTFTLDIEDQSDMQVHGRVVASMTVRHYA
ncbi:S24 family peptidase [Kosakonia oryziphila]|uniref:Peptidase S24-like n=1 Tax=Kosakonia oryziphila TaxID=1005667 RepID=A0A1C4G215_9ENTR|nr:S24 family peptidase [Kosakonia oryziphila]SCC62162.1 Peptidase S24-like [Kosakonia oryziphila]